MRIVLPVARVLGNVVGADDALAPKVGPNTAVLRGIGNFEKASRGTPESV
jgi:hypothetical protein